MALVLRPSIMRIEDFLGWEARQDTRWEFDGSEPVAMGGGSLNHTRIQTNLGIALGTRLRGSGCAFLGSDMKLLLLDRVRYPDGQVVCGPMGGGATFMTAPVLLFEVVSPGSAVLDHGDKAAEYRAVASVEAYVILEQDRAAATIHSRNGRGWRVARLTAGDAVVLPVLGLSVPMTELYEGIDLPHADQAGSGISSGK